MAEQLAVEVDVKNVTYIHSSSTQQYTAAAGQAHLFGLDNCHAQRTGLAEP